MNQLSASYQHCRRLARHSASNFAWSFWLLPRDKRRAMYALYAFMRQTDDLGDNAGPTADRRCALLAWRDEFASSLHGRSNHPLLPAIADTVRQFAIPPRYLHEVIDGVLSDCEDTTAANTPRFDTFDQLEGYCQQVASAVGLACIHVWGFNGDQALASARDCGIAFQLTNILRDLKEDADQGRIYLPREDFDRFDYSPDELRRGIRNSAFAELMRFEVARAEDYYQRAVALEPFLSTEGRRLFGTMVATYRGLLDKIKGLDTAVLERRARLSRWRKLQIVGSWLLMRPTLLVPGRQLPAGQFRQP
jgi:phytoene synthase